MTLNAITGVYLTFVFLNAAGLGTNLILGWQLHKPLKRLGVYGLFVRGLIFTIELFQFSLLCAFVARLEDMQPLQYRLILVFFACFVALMCTVIAFLKTQELIDTLVVLRRLNLNREHVMELIAMAKKEKYGDEWYKHVDDRGTLEP